MRKQRLTTLALVAAMHLGCGRNPERTDVSRESAEPPRIVAGIGVDGILIGMDVAKLGDHLWRWPKGNRPLAYDNEMFDKAGGIAIVGDDKEVLSISFVYKIEEWEGLIERPFRGETAAGIGPDATIAEVIAKYGQPASIHVIEKDAGKAVELNYTPQGIGFSFDNGVLGTISVFRPGGYGNLRDDDIGDTSEYRVLPSNEGRME